MDFWQGLLLITGIHLLASASPGPDFVLVSQQAQSRPAHQPGHRAGLGRASELFGAGLGGGGGQFGFFAAGD